MADSNFQAADELKELADSLSKDTEAISLFFQERSFDEWSIKLAAALAEKINGNEIPFAGEFIVWLHRNVAILNEATEAVKEQATTLLLAILGAEETRSQWVELHAKAYWLASELSDDLALVLLKSYRPRILRQWLYEKRLTQYMLWFWKQRIHLLDVNESLLLLRMVIAPTTEEKQHITGYAPDVEPWFQHGTGLYWHDLTEAYGKAEVSILGYLQQTSPRELIEVLTDTLGVAFYLDRIEQAGAPPNAGSSFYRSSIEDTAQTPDYSEGYHDHLMVLIRDTLVVLRDQSPDLWLSAVQELSSAKWYGFHRLAMNALAFAPFTLARKLLEENLPIWIKNFCAEADGADDEYHHELWVLLNKHSLELAKSGGAGKQMLRKCLVTLESRYSRFKEVLQQSKDFTESQLENYVGRSMKVWLRALEPALSLEEFVELRNRLDFYRSNKSRFGEDKESELFSHYIESGTVRNVATIGAEDFVAMVEETSMDAAIDYVRANPARKFHDDYKDGELISYNLNPMFKELGCKHPATGAALLKHTRADEVQAEYLGSLGYGLDELAGQLSAGKATRRLIPPLLDALDASLRFRASHLGMVFKREDRGLRIHGAYMALADAAEAVATPSHVQKVAKLALRAFDISNFTEADNEHSSRSVGKKDSEFEPVGVIEEVEYPLMAAIVCTAKATQLVKDSSSPAAVKALESAEAAIVEMLNSSRQHPCSRHVGRFLGENTWRLFGLGQSNNRLESATAALVSEAVKEQDTVFGRSFRYGFLRHGMASENHLDLLLPLYDVAITEYKRIDAKESYATSLAWHLFMLYTMARNGAEGDDPSPVSKPRLSKAVLGLIHRVLEQKTDVYDGLKRALIQSPSHLSSKHGANLWQRTLVPYYKLLLEGIGPSSKLYASLVTWARVLPDELALNKKLAPLVSAETVFTKALFSMSAGNFESHEVGDIIELCNKRAVLAEDSKSAVALLATVLRLCKKVKSADSQMYIPYWELTKCWSAVRCARERLTHDKDLAGIEQCQAVETLLSLLKVPEKN